MAVSGDESALSPSVELPPDRPPIRSEPSLLPLLFRRALAFLMDVNLYAIAWTLIENAAGAGFSEAFLTLMRGAGFVVYTVVFARGSPRAATPGMWLLRLRVRAADADRMRWSQLARRGLVPGLLLLVDWPVVLHQVV